MTLPSYLMLIPVSYFRVTTSIAIQAVYKYARYRNISSIPPKRLKGATLRMYYVDIIVPSFRALHSRGQ
jgi:hypothetical protein